MPAPTNTITTQQMLDGLDREMIRNFDQESDRLMEIFGIFGVEVLGANTTLLMKKIVGELSEEERTEGEDVPLSQYEVEEEPVGTFTPDFYRKATTAEAILKSGFVNACSRTDAKMMTQIRAKRVREFFDFLAKGTGKASGATLQAVLAQTDATLNGALEDHGDETENIFHFVNRFDIADYLANANVTTQTAYGMTYIKSFLGVDNIIVTNRVPKGTVYATPVENIRIYGTDFEELDKAGLSYVTSASGLLGVAHEPAYKNASAQTHAVSGMMLFAEIRDYIIIGTMGTAASASAQSAGEARSVAFDPSGDVPPTEGNKVAEIDAWAANHDIDLGTAKSKADKLAVISAALAEQNDGN